MSLKHEKDKSYSRLHCYINLVIFAFSSILRNQKRPIDISSVIRGPLHQDSSSTNKHGAQEGLTAASSDRTNIAPNSNSLIEGGLKLQSQNPLIAGGGRFSFKGTQSPRTSSNSLGAASTSAAEEVIVREAYKEDNLIVIKWDSETSNILGFRVVYRLFGKPEFKQGPPLGPSEREFRIKNVPANVCVNKFQNFEELFHLKIK